MYNALLLEVLTKRYRYGDKEYSQSAVNKVAEKHCKKCEQRVHTDRVAYDLLLDYLAYHAYYHPDDDKPDSAPDITGEHGYHRPRHEHRTGADHGQDIEHRNARRQSERIFFADAEKSQRELGKRDEHYYKV